MDDRLRPLWDFDDLDGTEARFAAQLDEEGSDEGRAEVLTQLARVAGLRGDFAAATGCSTRPLRSPATATLRPHESTSSAVGCDARAETSEAALPLFESAFSRALDAGQDFIAADAAHMAALAAPDREGFVRWTKRGIELAEQRDGASYWLGPLLNNLGWEYYEAGELEPALDAFERALARASATRRMRPRSRSPATRSGRRCAASAARTKRVPLLEQAVEWATREGAPDGWFHEELAEDYAAVGRLDDAREQARLAIPLLEAADPSFAEDAERESPRPSPRRD